MLDDVQQKELCELIDARWDGTITEAQAARLREWTCEDDDACRLYLDQMMLHGMLVLAHAEDDPTDALQAMTDDLTCDADTLPGQAAKSDHPVLGFLGDGLAAGMDFITRPFVLTLALTLGLPSVLLAVLLVHIQSEPVPVAPTVAQLTRTSACVWDDPDQAVAPGALLMPGQRLRLREGLIELAFADGAKVLLEGPAVFEATRGDRGFLQTGSLVATAPKGAEGFTIQTPLSKVVDLGTEFGVFVAPDGQAEAHVFAGKVEVEVGAATGEKLSQTKRLAAGEAVEVRTGGPGKAPQLVAMAATSRRFMRQLPQDRPEPKILFAHRGSNNPVSEGWSIHGDAKQMRKLGIELGPTNENGVPAWSLRTREDNHLIYYSIEKKNGLTPELLAEAREKGWVLRARVWMSPGNTPPPKKWLGIASFTYRDGKRGWTIRPSVDAAGNQCLDMLIGKNIVVPISGPRNRFVDYEVRCHPAEDRVDVFVNGRRVATRDLDDAIMKPDGPQDGAPQIRFGGWRPKIDARFALVEWGILRDGPTKPAEAGQKNAK